MGQIREVNVPDIGDFTDIEIIEVQVAAGDQVSAEDPLITLESDKAAMDVPAPANGTVVEVHVSVGDRVSEGSPIVRLEVADEAVDVGTPAPTDDMATKLTASAASAGTYDGSVDFETQLVVLGSGPGGYTAAFRAADLGL